MSQNQKKYCKYLKKKELKNCLKSKVKRDLEFFFQLE